jgi:hypothetical protein
MRPTKLTTVTLDRSSVAYSEYHSDGWETHTAVSKGRTLLRVYDTGLTKASGTFVRSEAVSSPDDPSLAACRMANFVSIWAMIASAWGRTKDRLIEVSGWCDVD